MNPGRVATPSITEYRWRLTQKIVWDGDWKFAFNSFDFNELYHLGDDPHEMHNLASEPSYKKQLRHMTHLFWQFAKQTGDTPITETYYAALRLGTVGPREEG